MSEEWRKSRINSNYEVSSLGRVRSKDRAGKVKASHRTKAYTRTWKGGILKPYLSSLTGYLQVELGSSGRQSVHRLIAMEFCSGYGDEVVVNHKNGVRDDNRAENLEWVTVSENVAHGFRSLGRKPTFLGKFGQEHATSKPVISTCMKTGEEKHYESAISATREGFDSGSISRCCHGKIRHHKGRFWRFALGGDHFSYREANQ